jgi:hypothetical protein
MRDPVDVPPNLRAAAAQDGRSGWLLTLPDAVALVERAWSLRVGQPFRAGRRPGLRPSLTPTTTSW